MSWWRGCSSWGCSIKNAIRFLFSSGKSMAKLWLISRLNDYSAPSPFISQDKLHILQQGWKTNYTHCEFLCEMPLCLTIMHAYIHIPNIYVYIYISVCVFAAWNFFLSYLLLLNKVKDIMIQCQFWIYLRTKKFNWRPHGDLCFCSRQGNITVYLRIEMTAW